MRDVDDEGADWGEIGFAAVMIFALICLMFSDTSCRVTTSPGGGGTIEVTPNQGK